MTDVLRWWVTQTAIEVRSVVLGYRQVLAQLLKVTEVNPGEAEAWSLRASCHHSAPGVYHHAVAITGSLIMVASTLCCCHYIALGFDGPGPQ